MYAVTDQWDGQQILTTNLYMHLTILNGTLVQSPTMSPYTRWVHDSFKHILDDSCDGYLQINDHGIDKGRSKFIAQVAADIADSARKGNVTLPNDLEKVWKCFLCIVA